ncbi:hypothetical protein HY382_00085 [Candidatus Curtissbacteria bacterium]|nr:hypothetical protein [Candidatus Curtissbacteria bacterium]
MIERVQQETLQLPIGQEVTEGIQRYYEKHGKQALIENERWRQKSRRANINICLPGNCPKPNKWPKPRLNVFEAD